jgi:aspartate/methionine/tyrosine aminotransferase
VTTEGASMYVYPPTIFYEKTRQTLNKNIIHISSGSNLLPVPTAFKGFIENHYTEKLTHLLGDYGDTGGPISVRKNMSRLENFRINAEYYDESNVFLTLGTTEGIDVSLLFLSKSHHHVFCFVPVYYSIGSCSHLYNLQLNSLCVLGETGWEVDMEQLERIDAKSILYLNSPNAISGYHIPNSLLKKIFLLIKEKGAICIFDQIIRDLTWECEFAHPLTLAKDADILNQIFFMYGPSKDKSIPGARIGYLYCPKPYAKQIGTILNLRYWSPPLILSDLSHLDSIINCLQAGFSDYIDFEMEREIDTNLLYENYTLSLKENIKVIRENMAQISSLLGPYLECPIQPSSGYSLFLKLSSHGRLDQAKFTRKLEMEHGLRTTFGPMFGLTQAHWETDYGLWLRLNATLAKASLGKGLVTLKEVLGKYL